VVVPWGGGRAAPRPPPPRLMGINNRDLRTFQIDLELTRRLAPLAPDGVLVVSESGIFTPDEVRDVCAAGAHAVLVGEALMRQEDVEAATRRLLAV
jgi:indole-3-glycerol phosphate synthase